MSSGLSFSERLRHDCWGVGDLGAYTSVYIDLSIVKS